MPETLMLSKEFPGDQRVFAPLIKGRGNDEATKYLALNALGVELIGERNVGKGGIPTYVGSGGRAQNYVGYVRRDLGEQKLLAAGFVELNDIVIRLG